MTASLPSHAGAVIIGGGIIGCSVAYHLVRAGLTDVVLLERKQLTSGTTWHAAGLIGQLRATHNMTRLARYTAELYATLEAETGQATGFRQTGSLSIATNAERLEEYKRSAAMARRFGLEAEVVGPAEVKRLWPLLNMHGVLGGVWLPKDGQINPIDVAQALAKGARMKGAKLFENIKVTDVIVENGAAVGVRTDRGDIRADAVVNCAGMWAREVGRMAGVNVPLHACEHFYIVTEPIEGLDATTPVLRDRGECAYYKEDAGKLLLGCFEPVAKPWGMDGIPEDFAFDSLPDDFDHFAPILEAAIARVPALETAGIQLFFNGPESFTPDNRYLLGEAPTLNRFFVAAGLNSIGIQSAGGAGMALAEWIVKGHAPMDLWDIDLRRMMPFQGNKRYLKDRVTEGLGLNYAMHWPYKQFASARPARRTALYERLKAAGACFGEASGWERANWYAPEGVVPEYKYSFGRQNWFDHAAAEHKATRENVALFDQSTFSKYLIQGRDAETALNRICAADVAVEPGRIVYTQWLNDRGGIEADVTVTRLDGTRFLILSGTGSQVRDQAWLARNIPGDAHATVTDVTSGFAVIGVMGPNARKVLAAASNADFSNDAFPFGVSREIEIGYAVARASRITYVGELGWELLVPTEFTVGVYDALIEIGTAYGLKHAGLHALESLRIEKAYRHWGTDLGDQDTPLEAGLGFAVGWKKADFIGRDALLRQKDAGAKRRLVQFRLKDSEPMLYRKEPVWRDGRIVGDLTSAMYGHTLGAAVGLGYVSDPSGGAVTADWIAAGGFEIEIGDTLYPAEVSLKPMYDSKGARIKA